MPARVRWLVLALGATLLVSLAANVVLVRALHESFARLQFARIFPLGYAPNEAGLARQNTREADIRETLTFWGDSRAYLWDTKALEQQRVVINRAHGGITSSQLLLQIETTPAVHTTYAVVQIGINDLHPLGALPENRQQILDTLRANLVSIRDALLARSDRVVLTTIFPPGPLPWQRRFAWDASTLANIDAMNRLITTIGQVPRVEVLDSNALLRDADGLLAASYADPDFFLHVNGAAYARLNAGLDPLLAQSVQAQR
jgi:lysophospholipase L1-like esterase